MTAIILKPFGITLLKLKTYMPINNDGDIND